MISFEREVDAPVEVVWDLVSRPERWPEWAYHVRGGLNLGDPEVEPGKRGWVRLLNLIPVPAHVTAKELERSWSWHVGPAKICHRVEPHGKGSIVIFQITASVALETYITAAYGWIVSLGLWNLARKAKALASEEKAIDATVVATDGVQEQRRSFFGGKKPRLAAAVSQQA